MNSITRRIDETRQWTPSCSKKHINNHGAVKLFLVRHKILHYFGRFHSDDNPASSLPSRQHVTRKFQTGNVNLSTYQNNLNINTKRFAFSSFSFLRMLFTSSTVNCYYLVNPIFMGFVLRLAPLNKLEIVFSVLCRRGDFKFVSFVKAASAARVTLPFSRRSFESKH